MIKYFEYGEREIEHLRKKDKKLGAAIDRMGILKREINPCPFSALVESIVGQQISNKAAVTVCRKLSDLSEMNPHKLCALSLEEIQACGMSMRKAGYIKNIAEAAIVSPSAKSASSPNFLSVSAVSKSIDFDDFPNKSDEEIIKTLTAIKGVGVWTAEMLLIFSLMRPNVVSYGDFAIRRGMMILYGLKELPKDKFLRYAKRYAPYGSVASLYLWEMSH